MQHKVNKVIRTVVVILLWGLCSDAYTQTGPFSGEAIVSLGSAQTVQPLSSITVPVKIDLSGLFATDFNAAQVPAALGNYRFAILYDATQLIPQLVNGTLPGGSTGQFASAIVTSSKLDGDLGQLIFSASQLSYGVPTGVVHVADIPFSVIGQAGSVAELSVHPLDLRTTLSLVASPTSLNGGAMMPFSAVTGQVTIASGNAPIASITAPADGSVYTFGDSITLAVLRVISKMVILALI